MRLLGRLSTLRIHKHLDWRWVQSTRLVITPRAIFSPWAPFLAITTLPGQIVIGPFRRILWCSLPWGWTDCLVGLQFDLVEKDVAVIVGTAVKLVFAGNFTPREQVPLQSVSWHAMTWVQRTYYEFLRLAEHNVLMSCPRLKLKRLKELKTHWGHVQVYKTGKG